MKLTLPFLLAFCLLGHSTVSAQMISEFQPNPPGADPMTMDFEIIGMAGQSFVGTIITIESDGYVGTVDRIASVSGTFDANGLLVVNIADFENPSFTVALLGTDNTVALDDDLDLDGDGTIDDLSVLGTIYDAIGIPDSESDATAGVYGASLGGQDFAFTGDEPKSVFRDGVSGDWYAINDPANDLIFDINANTVPNTDFDTDPLIAVNTFGSINPSRTTAPISLLTIEVAMRNTVAIINWATASETGNDYFVVERSKDGRNFEFVGRLAGAGDSQLSQSYQMSDNQPFEGISYYRLRQVDFDGTEAIFGPLSLRNEIYNPTPTIYPNPVGDQLQVAGLQSEVSQFSILDTQGRVLVNRSFLVNGGVSVANFPTGIYFLRFIQDGQIQQLRFTKR